MKYIDADRLREELQKSKTELKVGNYYLDNSEQAVGYENALIDFESLLDSLSEEPDKDLEEAAEKYAIEYAEREKPKDADGEIWKVGDVMIENRMSFEDGFKAGAEWQEKRWENNRLMAQDKATEEECQREMDFVDNHIKKHHRIPTFSDAINYGIEWQKKQMLKDAVEGEVIKTNKHTSVRYKSYYGTDRYFYGIADKQFKPGDKVRIIIVKENKK